MGSVSRSVSAFAGGVILFTAAVWANPTVSNIRLVSERRLDRFVIEATYRADVTSSAGAYTAVTATVSSTNPATTIVDGSLTFPDVALGATVTSTDTFTIRHDLHTPFQTSFLQFLVTAAIKEYPPVSNAGPDQTVKVGATVLLNGSGSSDPLGSHLTFQWALTSPPGSTAVLMNPTSVNPSFVADKPGSYTATLVVRNGLLSSPPDSVLISTANSAPVANAGPDRSAKTGATVTLDGSRSSDVDGDPLTFSWSFVSKPSGSAAVLSNSAAVMPAFTIDSFGNYRLQLVVNDGHVNSAPAFVNVNVENTAPVANAGPDQSVPDAGVVHLDGSRSTDIDGQLLRFHWSIANAPPGSTATLSNASAVTPDLTVDRPGTYVIQLIVNDGIVDSAADTMTIKTGSAPVANAGPDQRVKPGSTVTLNGSASSDADGNALTFAWSITSRPPGSAAVLSNPVGVMPSFVADQRGHYVVQLIVNDGAVNSSPDTAVINTENTAPVAKAGPNQAVTVGTPVTLNGSASSDADGDPLSYSWSFITRPDGSAAVLSNPGAVMPGFTADMPGDFVVQLIVNDGTENSLPSTVRITTTNAPPVANAGPDQVVAIGEAVQLNGAASSDPEGVTLKYRWSLTRPAGSAAILSNSNSATPGFVADVNGTYVAQLIVNDGFLDSSPDTVTIDTRDVPPVADAGPDRAVAAGSTVVLDGTKSHDADGQALTYAWSITSRPANSVAALSDPASATPSFVADKPGTYVIQLIVSDGTATSLDTVAITTENRPPLGEAGSDKTVQTGETVQLDGTASSDPDGGPLTYSWSIASAPAGSTATLSSPTSSKPSLTPDLPGTYVIRLIVRDGFLDSVPDEVTITASGPVNGGALINGFQHTGSIDGPGEVDTWTFTAASGDRIAIHIGEIVDRNDFRPWIRLQAPNGSNLGAGLGVAAAEIGDLIAPTTGTYKVLVASSDPGNNGTGTYRLTMVHSPGPISVAVGDEGGPLTNGGVHTGEIQTGDLDVWTFTATAGERVAVHIGEITDTADFRPWIRVWAPNGASLGSSSGVTATEIGDVIAPVTGTYLVLVASFDSGVDGTGTYRLNMVKSQGGNTVSNQDQGGPITNGGIHTGEIVRGDIDVWTFSATAGERIAVHIGEITDNDDFRPWIRVWAPDGSTLGSSSGVSATELGDLVAPVDGTYRIVVGSFDSGADGTGTYRLNMVKTNGDLVVSDGDQGGPLTNGGTHTGEIIRGDIDVWTFTAAVGERIAVHIGEITDTDDFRPWIRVWAPNGSTLGSASGVSATELGDLIAPVTGTYKVIVGTFDSGVDGIGTYRLNIVKTQGPVTVSSGDQGGPISNGGVHTGEIVRGDIDVWTFDAAAGERMAVHIAKLAETDDFRPWIRVWAPNGSTLGGSSGVVATELGDLIAPVTGKYQIIVGTFDSGVDGTGTYRLNMIKTQGPITVSAGDEGGPISNGGIHTGTIVPGDIDVWTFTAVAGERIAVHIGEITDTSDFRPWLRVWAPNGATLGSTSGIAAAELGDLIAPVTGTYFIVIGSFDSGVDGTGTYRLNMVKSQGGITVSSGDQGGPLTLGAASSGSIVPGDIDVWTFTATEGQRITVQITETAETSDFRPWIRVWTSTGATLGSVSGVSGATLSNLRAPVTGTYMVIVGSFDSGEDGSGSYQLVANAGP